MEHLMYLLKGYSLPVLLIASVVIFLVGCLKATKLFNRLSKQVKTVILFAIDIVLSAVGVLIYLAYTKTPITMANLTAMTPIEVACVLSMYSLYENVGIKKLIASILNLTITALKDSVAKTKDAKQRKQQESLLIMAQAVASLINAGVEPAQEAKHDECESSDLASINDTKLHRL